MGFRLFADDFSFYAAVVLTSFWCFVGVAWLARSVAFGYEVRFFNANAYHVVNNGFGTVERKFVVGGFATHVVGVTWNLDYEFGVEFELLAVSGWARFHMTKPYFWHGFFS